jgi:hypothetical protein
LPTVPPETLPLTATPKLSAPVVVALTLASSDWSLSTP